MLGANGSLVGQTEVYPHCVILEGSGNGSKYIVAMEFLPEAINCAIDLLVIVILDLIVVLILRFCAAVDPPPPDCSSSSLMGSV